MGHQHYQQGSHVRHRANIKIVCTACFSLYKIQRIPGPSTRALDKKLKTLILSSQFFKVKHRGALY